MDWTRNDELAAFVNATLAISEPKKLLKAGKLHICAVAISDLNQEPTTDHHAWATGAAWSLIELLEGAPPWINIKRFKVVDSSVFMKTCLRDNVETGASRLVEVHVVHPTGVENDAIYLQIRSRDACSATRNPHEYWAEDEEVDEGGVKRTLRAINKAIDSSEDCELASPFVAALVAGFALSNHVGPNEAQLGGFGAKNSCGPTKVEMCKM